LLDLFVECAATRLPLDGPIDTWLEQLSARPEEHVVVLVSGDPGVSSLAKRVLCRFGHKHCRVLPGISSVQVACCALGIPWENAAIISAHAALPSGAPALPADREPWVVLMGASGAEAWVAEVAKTEARSCFVCEDLTLPTERVAMTLPHQLALLSPHPRRIVVLTREFSYEQ
jgi:cobalt-precorrin-7 (C5)-methyltransferase